MVTMATIGILHPGEMGAAVAAALRAGGHDVVWASRGRSAATASRAREADLRDVGSPKVMAGACDIVLSVCPPHGAAGVARELRGFAGIYVDANAVSPATARAIGEIATSGAAAFVDGGIIGPPPREHGTTRLYLSGPAAGEAATVFAGPSLEAVVVSDLIGDA
jgi:3-hydroxyisobutyrate dehydrogenase-like beta-hydroxyacid dehydrogenase